MTLADREQQRVKNRWPAVVTLVFALVLPAQSLAAADLDTRLLRKINQAHSPWADKVICTVEDGLNLVYAVGPLLYVYGIAGDRPGLRESAALITSTVLLNGVLTFGTKRLVGRHRPFKVLPDLRRLDNPTGPSFPSGHTSAAFAFAGALTLQKKDWRVALPLYLWATVVGYGRIYEGVHYPSDVLAGALFGTGSAFLVHHLRHQVLSASSWFSRRFAGNDSRVYLNTLSVAPRRGFHLGVSVDF